MTYGQALVVSWVEFLLVLPFIVVAILYWYEFCDPRRENR